MEKSGGGDDVDENDAAAGVRQLAVC